MKKILLLTGIVVALSGCYQNTKTTANMENTGKCPFGFDGRGKPAEPAKEPEGNKYWSEKIDLDVLRKHTKTISPLGKYFDYAEAFNELDYYALKKDLAELMTQTQNWWPADYGHYGPLFIRMAWHSAGTYRYIDGRGGARFGFQRFAPLNSWPDNANLDKARRLLWPIKQKYGNKISWADLMILAGNVAIESMGLKTLGFSGGREDVWQAADDIYWGPESKWLADSRHNADGELENPLAASQMGLIYVNPEGIAGNPDPLEAAKAIRMTFARMGMNDEETVALIAGGHTFGKTHGMGDASYVGPEPEAADLENQGLGWQSSYKSGKGPDAFTSGLEVIWTPTPTRWSHAFFTTLFAHEWELTKSPAGAHQWVAKDAGEIFPDPFDPNKRHKPTMLTTDLSLREDPVYEKISRRFMTNPLEFDQAFVRAWYKLTHRDMGPRILHMGPEVPKEDFLWQDPLPTANYTLVNEHDIGNLKEQILASGLSVSDLVTTAWAAASTFRYSDFKGGVNGGRLRLEPQKSWEVNNPPRLQKVLGKLEEIQTAFNKAHEAQNKKISLADMIVLGGNAAIEKAAADGGFNIEVPFAPGRVDATQEQTSLESMAVLEPVADGFRNYVSKDKKSYTRFSAEELLIDKAELLTLTPEEMTVLLGGLRVLKANFDESNLGVFTTRPETLSNDFFVNLLDMNTKWEAIDEDKQLYKGIDRQTQAEKWTATRGDLLFGHHSELRALCELYASSGNERKFVDDFVAAWSKVMNLDRYDLQ